MGDVERLSMVHLLGTTLSSHELLLEWHIGNVGQSGILLDRLAAMLDTASLAAFFRTNSRLTEQRIGLWRVHLDTLATSLRLDTGASSRFNRLTKEFISWLCFPIPGFSVSLDGSLYKWICVIPGMQDTCLHGTEFVIEMDFPESYPEDPPVCRFQPGVYHVNVFPALSPLNPGRLSDEMIDKYGTWHPNSKYGSKEVAFSTREILLHFEQFLLYCNLYAPSQASAYQLLIDGAAEPALTWNPLRYPSGPLQLPEAGRREYMLKLRATGRPVARLPGENFGHKALPHSIVCTSMRDFEAALIASEGRVDRAIVAAYAGFWNPEGTLLRGGFYCDVSCVVEQEEEEEGEEEGEETKENEQEEGKEEEAKEEEAKKQEAKKQEGRPNLELAPTPST
jgi:ubiquitin-conjugating enzyme E2 I